MRVVIDTNVVFEGLTQRGSASGLIVLACLARRFNVCLSNALVYEYESVLARELAPQRWKMLQPTLMDLFNVAQFIQPFYTRRPLSSDPGDEHVIGCALNAGAVVITHNLRDFRQAQAEAGLTVLSPVNFVLEYLEV